MWHYEYSLLLNRAQNTKRMWHYEYSLLLNRAQNVKTMWHSLPVIKHKTVNWWRHCGTIIQSNPAMETSYLTRTGHQVGRVSAVGPATPHWHNFWRDSDLSSKSGQPGCSRILAVTVPPETRHCCGMLPRLLGFPQYAEEEELRRKKRHCCLRLGYVSASFSRFCVLLSSSEHTQSVPFWMFH